MAIVKALKIHVQIQKVLSEGSNTYNVVFIFKLMREKRIKIPLKGGHYQLISKMHQMAFRWRANYGPTWKASLVFQGIGTRIAKKHYIFEIFQVDS